MLQRIRNVLQVTYRRCYNVSGPSCKLLEEDVTTYQECLASYLQKMLQRSRKSLLTTQTTGRNKTPPPNPPQKKCAKVTTVPPLHGRRHQKHDQVSVATANQPTRLLVLVAGAKGDGEALMSSRRAGWKTSDGKMVGQWVRNGENMGNMSFKA